MSESDEFVMGLEYPRISSEECDAGMCVISHIVLLYICGPVGLGSMSWGNRCDTSNTDYHSEIQFGKTRRPLQGSPVSPVLSAIYIANIHSEVEGRVEDGRGISFVDDVTWVVEGEDMPDLVAKLERCAEGSLRWVESNAVRDKQGGGPFFSRSRRQWKGKGRRPIRVGTSRFSSPKKRQDG